MIVLNNTICAILYVFLFHIYVGADESSDETAVQLKCS